MAGPAPLKAGGRHRSLLSAVVSTFLLCITVGFPAGYGEIWPLGILGILWSLESLFIVLNSHEFSAKNSSQFWFMPAVCLVPWEPDGLKLAGFRPLGAASISLSPYEHES
jgi:hypothetical protein